MKEKEISLLNKEEDWSACFIMKRVECLGEHEVQKACVVVRDLGDSIVAVPIFPSHVNPASNGPRTWLKDECWVFDKDVAAQIKR